MIVQIVELGKQLPDDAATKAWAAQLWDEARRKRREPAAQQEYVRDQLEKLVAKYKADGTLPKPKPGDAVTGTDDAGPAADQDALVLQILHLGLQLPEAEVKQVWDEARRRERDPVKQREWAKEQMEKLIAKHKADGTLPKPKSDPPDPKSRRSTLRRGIRENSGSQRFPGARILRIRPLCLQPALQSQAPLPKLWCGRLVSTTICLGLGNERSRRPLSSEAGLAYANPGLRL